MKSNTKKRLIAFMLCMVLVLSSATSAFADEPQNTDSQSQTEAVAEPAQMRLQEMRLQEMRLIQLTSKYLRKKNGQYKLEMLLLK